MLLSNKFKKIGWVLFFPSLLLGAYILLNQESSLWDNPSLEWPVFAVWAEGVFTKPVYFSFTSQPILPTLVASVFVIACLFLGFSKEKVEDEYIKSLRLSSLQWAVLVNSIILLLAILFVYGIPFLYVMQYNMFTVLLLFVIRFNFLLYKSAKNLTHEE